MNNVVASFQGWNKCVQGWFVRIGVLCVGAACLFGPLSANAASKITQAEFLGWLASVSGEADGAGTGVSDLITWATSKGLAPDGGWQPNKVLTKQVLAQTLVQLFNLNPKAYKGDFERNLLRQGIVLPEEDELSRLALIQTVDQFGFQSKTYVMSRSRGSGVNGDNGHPGNIVPPGFRNPRNPHYGLFPTDPDNRPGHVGLGNGANNGNRNDR